MTETAPFPIVGVGASAGGIEALAGLFSGIPDHPGFAVVIVTHLNPARISLLHEVVGRYTQMPVFIAANEARVAIDTVYVLPEDAVLSIEGGCLQIAQPEPTRRVRKPIDVFLGALGRDLGEYAAGVVLSGGDGDGTLGIKVIKEHGGLTLAQVADGHGPGHPSMPDSAIATGYVDFALPADAMGAKLIQFARSLAAKGVGLGSSEDGTLDAARERIYAILRNQVGHDFSGYKTNTFLRRVQRRMHVAQLDSADAYVALLQDNPAEAQALFRDLLINVTSFFRDVDAFETLASQVVPKLFEGRSATETVRVWVPGCATGEEVYSIAILLREHMSTLAAAPRLQVFATDIDEHALNIARAARYPAALLDSVTPERQRRYFVQDGGAYVVAKEVRDVCIFSPHSIIRDPPFSRMDMVSCRNLLIYLGANVQNQVLPTFHYALRGSGYLFLGTSENASQFRDLFTPLDKRNRIFRKREDVISAARLPLMVRDLRPFTSGAASPSRRVPVGGVSLRQSVHNQVLERFGPPHVVVNREGDVVYFSSRTGKYLEAPAGLPNRQLLTMARKGLRLDLRTLFREAVEFERLAMRGSIPVEGEDGRVQIVTITVEPLAGYDGEPAYLVLFTDEGPAVSREEAIARSLPTRDGVAVQLEEELRETRERLQSVVEEYETALEELKSSNEELQSVNEEFQSTNEELEASKEELQSLNEELHTVNTELTGKVDALDRSNTDLQNLFDSTNVATVFLDGRLVIRSFTPAMSALFNILPTDRGRPMTDLTGQIKLPTLAEDVRDVIAGRAMIERQIDLHDGEGHYLLRVTPYENAAGLTDGVAVTFVDVTGLTRAEARLRVLVAELQHRTRNLLGVVQAIARQTIGKGGSLDAFKERLSALGRVQGLISLAADDTVELGDILRMELQAHGAEEDGKVMLDGPHVALRLEHVQAVALVVHELATNAVKYGALQCDAGRLAIWWRQVQDGPDGDKLVMDWRESGVDIPSGAAERSGFGRQLIERSLAMTMRATTSFAFGPDGVTCRIEVPVGRLPPEPVAP